MAEVLAVLAGVRFHSLREPVDAVLAGLVHRGSHQALVALSWSGGEDVLIVSSESATASGAGAWKVGGRHGCQVACWLHGYGCGGRHCCHFLKKVKLLTVKERSPVYMADTDRSENRRLTRCDTLSDVAAELRRKWIVAVILEAGNCERNSSAILCKRQVQKVYRIFRQIGYGT